VRNVVHDIAFLVTLAIIAIIWIIPAVLVARVAERRGRSFAPFLIAALIIPWPVMLLVALVLPRRSKEGSSEREETG
jgi:hypothetical protein